MPLRATAIENKLAVLPELALIEYDAGKLSICAFKELRQIASVSFDTVEGFRVLDEGDLIEFWPTCSFTQSEGSWLWEIHEGGWFDFEATRSGFIAEKYGDAKEYLIIGVNECIHVLSFDRPVVTSSVA